MIVIPWDEYHPNFYLDAEDLFGENLAANLDYWGKAAYWTIEEGTTLSLGYEPRVLNWELLKDSDHPVTRIYEDRRNLAARARDMGELSDRNEPLAYIRWARSLGLSFCPELDAIIRNGQRTKKAAQALSDEALHPKTKQSLQKLVLGMAAAMYGYDPKQGRTTIHQEIKDELDRVGISLNVDTVRQQITDAADVFGDLVSIGDKAP